MVVSRGDGSALAAGALAGAEELAFEFEELVVTLSEALVFAGLLVCREGQEDCEGFVDTALFLVRPSEPVAGRRRLAGCLEDLDGLGRAIRSYEQLAQADGIRDVVDSLRERASSRAMVSR